MFAALPGSPDHATLERLYQRLDVDGTGSITLSELYQVPSEEWASRLSNVRILFISVGIVTPADLMSTPTWLPNTEEHQ